ncbi:hypothetical protein BD324DRAFT_650644 [Kockovaella imperatae]|uniref:NUA/TPR/MLP1-2-like domain-containing protein n=1 Tax=Kockovaella imperatae TaxID=4999 RepID=A0A1Y1UG34_9TREE|nr:hypothetical protein BD324DRAFT_650644 [Kockovaella imperatae]ORX37030.1 hypothetical protein BD324DRAFT_650644 [Kockovaella imperatae]
MSDDPSSSSSSTAAAQPTSSLPGHSTSDPTTEEIRRQVENEQALTDSRRRITELKEELRKAVEEKQALQDDRQGVASESAQLRTQLAALQSTHHKSASELTVLQTRVEAVEREKRELIEETERLQQRSNRITQDLFTLRSQRQDSSQKLAHLEVEVSELRMAAESSKFNEQRSAQALQTARNEILQLNKSVADVDERFAKYRAEKSSELSQLQLEHDTIVSRLTSTDHLYHALQRTYNDQSKRLAEAHENIRALTDAAANRKISTSSEFARLMEENRILKKRAEEARSTITEREAELERVADSAGEKTRVWEEKWKKEERLRREAEKRAEDLQIVVERLAMAGGEGSDLSPAAALATGMKQSGKTYTQFYTDYTIQEGKLRAAENEVSRLTQLLDEISADISEKKPLLDEQAAEHARAIERANALALELASVMSARDARDVELRSLNASSSLHKDEVASLTSTTEDLSRQVQTLLRQIAIRDDPSLASQTMDGNATVSETGDLVTDYFVEFKSIRSLQQQNQKLLKLTRGLMAKLDAQEIDRAGADAEDLETGATLEQATETITKLHAQLLDAQKKINEATRERDFFSKLLARGDGLKWSSPSGGPLEDGSAPHEQALTTLQVEIESIRLKAEQDISDAREQLRTKSEEAGQAEIAKVRAEAQISMLQEQHRMMTDANALQKQELSGLHDEMRKLHESIAVAGVERRLALEQVASRQGEADRLRNDLANLRAEKEQLASTEARLQSDFRSVQSERARLQQLIDNLQTVNSEHEKTRAEDRARLERRVEEVERNMSTLRSQLDAAKEATAAAEKRADDIQPRIDAATAFVRAEKSAAEAQVQALTSEIATLKEELEKVKAESEKRMRIGLSHQRRANDMMAEKKRNEEALSSKDTEIAELTEKVGAATKELDEVKGKVAEAEKKLVDVERGSTLKDATVSRLQSELAKAQSGASVASGDSSTITALRTEKESLQQKLAQAEKDLAEAKAVASAAAPTGQSTSSDLQARVQELEKDKEAYDQKYEENITKVNRVNASLSQRLRTVDEIRVSLEAKIADLEKQISEHQAGATGQPGTASSGPPDQSAIDAAVKSAVSAREAELEAEHSKALAAARSENISIKADPSESMDAQRAQLESSFSKRVDDAVAAQKAELEKQVNDLNGQVATLETKVKTLERQIKTAEISRKTIERQRADLESKLKKYEGEGSSASATPASSGASGLSAGAPAFQPGDSAQTPTSQPPTAAGASVMPAPAGSSPASIRGKGRATRGTGRGGKANTVLSAVNATLAQTGTPSTPAATGTKRPAPEDGEIAEDASGAASESTAASSTGASILQRIAPAAVGGASGAGPPAGAGGAGATPGGTRQLKRPRGLGGGRGGAPPGAGGAGVAASGSSAATTAATSTETNTGGKDEQNGNGNGASGSGAGEGTGGGGAGGEGSGTGTGTGIGSS